MRNQTISFPFTGIVGQDTMKRSLILNAVDPNIGGVLIRGERGTAKSTAARALAALLPEIQVIKGCRFNCDPSDPDAWCEDCINAYAQPTLEIMLKPTSFVNLPVSATEDRVVGTLDIEKAITEGVRRFEPGVLAAANRGILYVDEVNLLDDHIIDVLLDAAAMGVNRIEREGISYSHPARFILVGTMNPEEGDLRPQLLDRFAHSVEIKGITDADDRVEIMKRGLAYKSDPQGFAEAYRHSEQELRERIAAAKDRLPSVKYTSADLYLIASLTASLHVEGHRADLVILRTALANAAFEGRTSITPADIAAAAELALPHRLKKGPFSEADISSEALSQRISELIPDPENRSAEKKS